MDINILEITSKNCYKCDLETTIDNNSQYFWINLREFEVNETERKWFNIFNKHGKQVIKSCKTTNIEFTMLKKKLGICLYEENYYTEEIIQIQDNTEVTSIKEISKVSNKNSTKKLIDESDNKSIEVTDKV